ncbi:hypothetical protein CKO44_16665 [Rubrivivax gelatinosus]|uniref:DUF2975 family protein n=1 Tax=Rubrivivax gelatinosus TaxID=28068 RepID=A0ABS1DX80_RUBGE|nr:DUF2975 domain-containing protein [Rubrivivax gelatinosus]MBK1615102.1 hypothetical protein [Rubrivivax gelatinosus]MBK1713795.1 hypothetical protein [Rubrivivax gelatinosus]
MPSDDIEPRSRRLRRLCRFVRGAVLLAAVVLLAWPLVLAARPELLAEIGRQSAGLQEHPLTLDARGQALAIAAMLPPTALGLLLCSLLWRLFGAYQRGQALSAGAQRRLQQVGATLLALALVQPLSDAALSVALTIGNPPGQRLLTLGFDSGDYLLVVVAVTILAVATAMHEAVRAAEENRGFV